MNNLLTRTLTGALFVAVMAGGILWNIYSLVALFSLIALAGLWEFYTMIEKKERAVQKLPGMSLAVILLLAASGKYFVQVNTQQPVPGLQHAVLIFPLLLIYRLLGKKNISGLFSPTLFGLFYAVLPFCYLILSFSSFTFFEQSNNSFLIMGFFVLIWANDTFAYLTGIAIGRTKLFESVSPKKTWEGTIGGALCTMGAAWGLGHYLPELQPIQWINVALLVSVFGTLGDLVESKLKREMDVKDSGSLLPGHGGLLDRFDGALLAAPFVMLYLWIVL